MGVHRVHGCEEHGLPVPFGASSSWNQSTFDDGVHFVSVPDVVDVLGEVIRQQYIVLQCRLFVHRNSGFVQIVLNFFQILIGVHRVSRL